MSFPILVPILAALAGTVVGGLIAELRTLFEARRDATKVLNTVLFHQLGIYYALHRSDVEHLVREAAGVMAQHFGVSAELITTEFFRNTELRGAVAQLIDLTADHELGNRYEDAVASLAPTHPVLAYRLSGRKALTRHSEYLENYLRALSPAGEESPGAREVRETFTNTLKGQVQSSAVANLERDIILVASKLGWRVRKQARQSLRHLREKASLEQSEESREFLERLSAIIPSAAAPPSVA